VIDTLNDELPGTAAENRGLDGDAVANLPAKPFRGASANDCPLAVLEEIISLVVSHN
jgi:hypothetical protein